MTVLLTCAILGAIISSMSLGYHSNSSDTSTPVGHTANLLLFISMTILITEKII